MKLSLPTIDRRRVRVAVLTLMPLALFDALAWYLSDRVIDGKLIVSALASMTGLNIFLVAGLMPRLPRFGVAVLVASYFFHLLFFLFYALEQRLIVSGGI